MLENSFDDLVNGIWTPNLDWHWDRSNILINGEWVYHYSNEVSFIRNGNHYNQMMINSGSILSVSEVDISGQYITHYLKKKADITDSESIMEEITDQNTVFVPGAKAYLVSAREISDSYIVDLDNDDPDHECFGTTIIWEDVTTNCNVVTTEESDTELTNMEGLFSIGNNKIIHTDMFDLIINRDNVDDQKGATLIDPYMSDDWIETTWRFKEPAPGIKVFAIKIPNQMKEDDDWYRFGQTEVFLVMIDGFLRSGEFTPKGTIYPWVGYEFNSIAMDTILEQFNP